MATIASVKVSFDAAHVLQGYAGKCGNLHGHTYKLEVSVQSESSNKMGMVVDYNILKPIVKKVADSYDHAYLCGSEDPKELVDTLLFLGYKIKYVNGWSSTENLARQIGRELREVLSETREDCKLLEVKLSETDSTYARYIPGVSEL